MTPAAPLGEHAAKKRERIHTIKIDAIFGVSPTATIKYQLGISKQWRDKHAGQIIVSGTRFET